MNFLERIKSNNVFKRRIIIEIKSISKKEPVAVAKEPVY